ncbi:FliM/FliN family flagellar motor switch protein [Bartonella bovis]|uniref:Flagellar motor switch protein FliM n=1 Tax=Bartonella bovis 91-4 TaxID=1094491 RepID=N6UC26_9HYPH|nr:FliM/FliN family flagellar motor switch protein [Bartonella bovis]ENN90179.1 flagellar motor switch protein FliM [Bartonella bovis 91-4]
MTEQTEHNINEEKKQDVLAQHILRAAGLSSDDLMSFQYVFRDAASNLCAQLGHYTSLEFAIDVQSLDTLKADKLAQAIAADTLLIYFSSNLWGDDVIFVLDTALVDLITEAFFGAAEPKIINRNGRPFSPTEYKISEYFGKLLANTMDGIFGTGDGSLLLFKQTLKAQEFNLETFHQSQMFSCNLGVKCNEIEATVNILMPRSCHRPIQEAVTRALRTPAKHTDPLWAKRLKQEVSRTHVCIEAFIQQGSMTLNELSKLQIGQVLPLPANSVKQIKLRSGKKSLYKCSLGKKGKNFSIRVTDPIDEEKEMIDELVHS